MEEENGKILKKVSQHIKTTHHIILHLLHTLSCLSLSRSLSLPLFLSFSRFIQHCCKCVNWPHFVQFTMPIPNIDSNGNNDNIFIIIIIIIIFIITDQFEVGILKEKYNPTSAIRISKTVHHQHHYHIRLIYGL